MTDAKFNDLSKDASEVLRLDRTYRITVFSYGNKVTISFDTKLDQNLGTLRDMLSVALQNGAQWFEEKWVSTPEGKRKLERTQATLDQIPKQ